MTENEDMVNMVEAMVEECVDEAVKAKVKDATMTIVNKVVCNMSKTDPGFSSIKDAVRRKMSQFTIANIHLLAGKRVLETKLVFDQRIVALVKKLEDHSDTREGKFEILDSLVTAAALDAEEDTLGEGGDITTILNTAHCINDADVKFLKETVADLKKELPGEAYVDQISSELSAIAEQEKAINKLFEESGDEKMIKDEKKVNAIK
ncbi:hypothetical protein QM012_002424 [Aureobasidium pullulans]|uniref:Uncharacterized protein n=1 Tax=Aureobasidium pullulans TaxID=5580 RepID=A0ABR0TC03_AURPU